MVKAWKGLDPVDFERVVYRMLIVAGGSTANDKGRFFREKAAKSTDFSLNDFGEGWIDEAEGDSPGVSRLGTGADFIDGKIGSEVSDAPAEIRSGGCGHHGPQFVVFSCGSGDHDFRGVRRQLVAGGGTEQHLPNDGGGQVLLSGSNRAFLPGIPDLPDQGSDDEVKRWTLPQVGAGALENAPEAVGLVGPQGGHPGGDEIAGAMQRIGIDGELANLLFRFSGQHGLQFRRGESGDGANAEPTFGEMTESLEPLNFLLRVEAPIGVCSRRGNGFIPTLPNANHVRANTAALTGCLDRVKHALGGAWGGGMTVASCPETAFNRRLRRSLPNRCVWMGMKPRRHFLSC